MCKSIRSSFSLIIFIWSRNSRIWFSGDVSYRINPPGVPWCTPVVSWRVRGGGIAAIVSYLINPLGVPWCTPNVSWRVRGGGIAIVSYRASGDGAATESCRVRGVGAITVVWRVKRVGAPSVSCRVIRGGVSGQGELSIQSLNVAVAFSSLGSSCSLVSILQLLRGYYIKQKHNQFYVGASPPTTPLFLYKII